MQHMAAALAQMQAAVRQQEERRQQALVQDQRMQEVMALMAQNQAAIVALTERMNRMLECMGTFERAGVVAPEQQPLEQLECRMESLEASVQRGLESVFPRAKNMVARLEIPPPGAPSSSTDTSTSLSVSNCPHSNVSPMGVILRDSATTATFSTAPLPSPFECKLSMPPATRTSTSSGPSPHPGPTSHQASTSTNADSHILPAVCQESIYNLWEAVKNGRVTYVQRLLDRGVDVNSRDSVGLTPLMSAAAFAQVHMLEILLSRGADAALTTINDNTALHIAAIRDASGSCVHQLMKAGADVGSKDVYGNTPLHRAVGRGNEAAVRALREGRANPRIRNNAGFTPLDLAQNLAMRRLLL